MNLPWGPDCPWCLHSLKGFLPAQTGRPVEAATALLHQNSLFWPKYSRHKPQTQSGQQERSIWPDISPSTFEKKLNPANEEPAVHRQLLQQGKPRAGFSESGLWTKVPKFCANFTADICLDPALNLPLFVWRTAKLPRRFTASPLNSVIPLRDLGVEGPAQKKLFFYKSKAKEDIKQQSQPEGTGRILRCNMLGKGKPQAQGPLTSADTAATVLRPSSEVSWLQFLYMEVKDH